MSGNSSDGVHTKGNVSENEISGNTISGNTTSVRIVGAEAIGTSASKAADLDNSGFGVFINAPGTFIGATASGEGNTIAFNGQEGVVIEES